MLGWEYPPFVNGGLGVASAHIARSLAAHAALTLMVPRSPKLADALPYDLIGMQGRSLPDTWGKEMTKRQELLREVRTRYIEVRLAGYERNPRRMEPVEEEVFLTVERHVVQDVLLRPGKTFMLDETYGPDLLERVQDFAELVRSEAQGLDYDLIHAHDWMTFLAGLELKAATGRPLVLHLHSLEYDRSGPGVRNWIYKLERHAMEQADLVLAVSHYTAERIRDYYQIAPDKIKTVPNGVDPVVPYRRERPFPERLVVFLGRLEDQKGPSYFLEAARQVLAGRRDVRFVVAGKGEQIRQLIYRVAEARLGDRIHFAGHLEKEHVQDLLAMADVYVMSSVSEPFGLSALEAAQMDVPCIVSRQSGVYEVMGGAAGVDYWDTEEMARQIGALLDDPAYRDAIRAGQRKDLQQLSWEGAASRMMDLFGTLT
ncbi:MAG: glycosyltransferase family 4 protein [Bacteroidia bacterium]